MFRRRQSDPAERAVPVEQALPDPEATNDLDRVIESLVQRGLMEVERRHGPNSPNPKPYHGPEHTRLVFNSAEQIADLALVAGKITARQRKIIRVVPPYHDLIYVPGATDNELQSAMVLQRHMRIFGVLGEQDIHDALTALMATEVEEVTPTRIVQAVDQNHYLSMIMADADTSSFGSPPEIYWDMATRYFKETNPGVALEAEDLQRFVQSQIPRVEGHVYYTDEARQLFNHQPENLEFLRSIAA
jgi:predicted metal-dependent HD superfamily phosphohydrolase